MQNTNININKNEIGACECKQAPIIKIQTTDGSIPEYKSKGAAGFDLKFDKIPKDKDNFITGEDLIKLSQTKGYEYLRDLILENIYVDKTYYILFPNSKVLLPTPYKVEIPEGYEMEIRPRSSAGTKTKLYIHNGTIDSDYRGTIGIIIINNSDETYLLEEGQSLAQGIIRKCEQVIFKIDELNNTERGEKGFGSTGN